MMNSSDKRRILFLFLGFLMVGWLPMASAADPATLNGWTITSGPIKTSNSSTRPRAKLVKGSFELKTEDRPASTRRAGACLLADLTTQGVGLASCTSHQQCNDAYKAAPHPELGSGSPGPYLYCLAQERDATEKLCWIRPGPDTSHCVKNEFAPGKHAIPATMPGSAGPSTVTADPLGNKKPVRWMVYGCLNPDNSLPPACQNPASTAKVNSLGKVKKVKP